LFLTKEVTVRLQITYPLILNLLCIGFIFFHQPSFSAILYGTSDTPSKKSVELKNILMKSNSRAAKSQSQFKGLNENGTRLNVMECSHAEVMAYMAVPAEGIGNDPLDNYDEFSKALKDAEQLNAAEGSIEDCASVLYSDLSIIGEEMANAVSAFSYSDLRNQVTDAAIDKTLDKLMGSVCKRMDGAIDKGLETFSTEINKAKRDALDDVASKYGTDALVKKASTDFIEPELGGRLRANGGALEINSFIKESSQHWGKKLEKISNDKLELDQ
jgi:hypothetical protein